MSIRIDRDWLYTLCENEYEKSSRCKRSERRKTTEITGMWICTYKNEKNKNQKKII